MPNDQDLKQLTDLIYGDGASTSPEIMAMIGSTVLNRLDSGRIEEFGGNMQEVINHQNAYYAAQDNTDLYQQGVSGNFPDETSQKAYKQAMAVASGLMKGSIDRHKAMFYFKEKEEMRIRNAGDDGKKEFNFDVVNRADDSGDYRTYTYEQTKRKKDNSPARENDVDFDTAFATARKQGLKEFEWDNKKYNTKVK